MNTASPIQRLLLVNHDPKFSAVLTRNLKAIGNFDVVETTSVEQALDLVKDQTFNVVLTEHQDGEINGLQLTHDMRREEIIKPEIILLSNDPRLSIFECHQVGACHLVRKPVNLDELTAIINRIGAASRRFERITINPATLGQLFGQVTMVGKKERFHVEVSNLGRGGFFFKIANESDLPELGQVVEFSLKLGMVPNYHFEGRGIIRWIRKTPTETGAGVEFLTIPEDSERLVVAFVDLFKVRPFVPDSA